MEHLLQMHIKQRWLYLENLDKHILKEKEPSPDLFRIIMSYNPQ